jgi:GT2 family glycosyltransferase
MNVIQPAGTTSIIIPTSDGLPLLQACIAAIRRYTVAEDTPYEIIVIDDGSVDGTASWCKQERIPFIRLPVSRGCPAACNKGLRLASGDNLLLLHNDVIVTKDWLAGLLEALHDEADTGLVGPVANKANGRQQVAFPFADLKEFQRIAAHTNRSEQGESEPALRIDGFCLLFKREVAERIGELDEQFAPGRYEADDFCLRARMNGYGIRVCRDVLVYHEGNASFRRKTAKQQKSLIKRSLRLFMKKWDADPLWYL